MPTKEEIFEKHATAALEELKQEELKSAQLRADQRQIETLTGQIEALSAELAVLAKEPSKYRALLVEKRALHNNLYEQLVQLGAASDGRPKNRQFSEITSGGKIWTYNSK